MLSLYGNTDLLRVTTGSAGDIRRSVEVMHASNATPPVVQAPPSVNGPGAAITTATTTTLVDATGITSGHLYNVKGCTLYNAHATNSNELTVDVYDSTNTAIKWHGTLLAGESVVLDELGIWTLYGTDGVPKPATAQLITTVRTTADVVNATTSWADITGLSVPVKSGKFYTFEVFVVHQTNATTTGARFGVSIGATPTVLKLWGQSQITSSVTAATFGASAMVTAVDTAVVVETTGPGAVNMGAWYSGIIQPSADGTLSARFQSEVAVASALTAIGNCCWMKVIQVS